MNIDRAISDDIRLYDIINNIYLFSSATSKFLKRLNSIISYNMRYSELDIDYNESFNIRMNSIF